jgi:hypothetical protein
VNLVQIKKSQSSRKVASKLNCRRMMSVDVTRKDVVCDGWKWCQQGVVGKLRWVMDGYWTAGVCSCRWQQIIINSIILSQEYCSMHLLSWAPSKPSFAATPLAHANIIVG